MSGKTGILPVWRHTTHDTGGIATQASVGAQFDNEMNAMKEVNSA